MYKKIVVWVTLVVALFFTSSGVLAQPHIPDKPIQPISSGELGFEAQNVETRTWQENGVIHVEMSQLRTEIVGQFGQPSPDGSSNRTVGGDSIRYANAISYIGGISKQVRYEYAITEKLSGPSTLYKTHAHGALKRGTGTFDPIVFGNPPDACASKDTTNGKAQTCTSSWFSTTGGAKWSVYSGHSYDINANGVDDTCSGCIDWVYTVP